MQKDGDIMNNVSFILAFSAGLLSFLSPCVLPLVPAYVSYITGTTIGETKNKKSNLYVLYKSFGFVIGFSLIFIIMGASMTSLGKIFITNQEIFRKISGALIFIFGLHTTGIFKIKLFYREKRFLSFSRTNGTFGSFLMGMAFAAGWTPCVGPILSSILVYASSMETISKGIILLVFYSLGLAVPFIQTALAIDSLSSRIRNLGRYLKIISLISGILMIVMGVLIFTNKIGILSQYLNFINF
jgi:cytochrome c-type biogenesis protein